jgi:hypothetical protein
MAWITPVTNRTALAPGYLNVSDWVRIRDNTVYLASILGVSLDSVATPTTTTFMSIAELNYLCHNIELLRLALPLPGLTAIKYTWLEDSPVTPTYRDVNKWEQTLATIAVYFQRRHARAGVSASGSNAMRQNRWRS